MGGGPSIHKFTSITGKSYVYDANTQEIARVDRALYDIIDDPVMLNIECLQAKWASRHLPGAIEVALGAILKAQKQGLFLPSQARRMVPPACDQCIEDMLRTKSGKLTINATHDCNLRCIYCTYSGLYEGHRTHQARASDVQCGTSAIELLMRRTAEAPEHHVSFYGGEPALEFELVTSVIKYAKKHYPKGKFSFQVATNGTLWSEDMLKFCIANDVSLQISLDGPEPIHDRYRRDKLGRGSYARVHAMLGQLGSLIDATTKQSYHLVRR